MELKNMSLKSKPMMMSGDDEVVRDVGYSNKGINGDKIEGPEYPYCLKLYLGPDELKMLGIVDMPALGSSIDMMAKVKVVSQRIDEYGNTMEIQITDMVLGKEEKKMNAMKALYGESETSEKKA